VIVEIYYLRGGGVGGGVFVTTSTKLDVLCIIISRMRTSSVLKTRWPTYGEYLGLLRMKNSDTWNENINISARVDPA